MNFFFNYIYRISTRNNINLIFKFLLYIIILFTLYEFITYITDLAFAVENVPSNVPTQPKKRIIVYYIGNPKPLLTFMAFEITLDYLQLIMNYDPNAPIPQKTPLYPIDVVFTYTLPDRIYELDLTSLPPVWKSLFDIQINMPYVFNKFDLHFNSLSTTELLTPLTFEYKQQLLKDLARIQNDIMTIQNMALLHYIEADIGGMEPLQRLSLLNGQLILDLMRGDIHNYYQLNESLTEWINYPYERLHKDLSPVKVYLLEWDDNRPVKAVLEHSSETKEKIAQMRRLLSAIKRLRSQGAF